MTMVAIGQIGRISWFGMTLDRGLKSSDDCEMEIDLTHSSEFPDVSESIPQSRSYIRRRRARDGMTGNI
jgi:hypothetical protein